MILYPAIDILGGHAVRLARGEYDARTEYDADPLDAARRWVADGARVLHVVDLDGARDGAPANLHHVRRIAEAVDVPVQVGGGLRTAEAVDAVLQAGASRAILGTVALRDPALVQRVVQRHGERIVVSIDARRGMVAAAGWIDQTQTPAHEAIAELSSRGVTRFVYSSIERDGMLSGPDTAEVTAIAAAMPGPFIYSGGVSSLDDLITLAELKLDNLDGAIVGTALYERRFGVAEGQRALDQAAVA